MSEPQTKLPVDPVCREAIERLLASMSKARGEDGLRAAFLFGKPGAPLFARNLGIEIFYSRKKILAAVLYVRANGPSHLRQMAVQDIQSMLTTFVSENFGYLADETMFTQVEGAFSGCVSPQTKDVLAAALAESLIFKPPTELTLYPLVAVRVDQDFESGTFCFIQPSALTPARLGIHPRNTLFPDKFPPFNERGRKEDVLSWLGVSAPTFAIAEKRKAAVLGALALTLPRHERKMFSGRHTYGGRCTVSARGATESFGETNVPPLMHDAVVEAQDHPWMAVLAAKLLSGDNTDKRHCRALEYFYRAWPLDPNESFSHLFMGMDSIFGDSSQATQAVIEAVTKHGGFAFPYERLKLLLGLRATVIHGGAPDVHDSDKYHRYYETYGDDPIIDIELIAARCFRAVIFDDLLPERPDRREEMRRSKSRA
ncbi:hypothetical protein HNR60_003305 [Rhodopseudomonas rhenobacensis]|uniref:Apea-like HEPN domain-containing protein n=1 Tax=Rhodopseudomonas rhenobacensis TaxID=87461 RepID=A0A7W7Z625_9BRAD|nr:hypothetical protein [Rhodopseudomonas rhenobacensis]MBB5048538.1 hypothetical protein [Rhodopseudomonas rhenobacensis]